jgi:small subunit ribosomal protein S16
MALRIRMARGGAKKRPYYRIVIADSRSPRDGRFVEKIGTYNPLLASDDPNRLKLDVDRAKYWLGHGATPSERVARFLGSVGVIEMPANRVRPTKSLPKAKAQERAAAAVVAAEAAETAAAEAAAAPPEEAPAEEAPAEEAAAEEAPAEEAAAEEAVAEEAPAEEAAAEEAPAKEAPAEEADGEEKPSG